MASKYGEKAKSSVMKRGKLKSRAKSKTTGKSRKQAIAIGLSEARKKGAKVPAKKKSKK
jgi:hypothetical protein